MQGTRTEVSTARRAALFARMTLAGIILYVVLDVIAQLLPPRYSPFAQPESDLAVGPYGFVMSINFVVRGLLSLAAVQALRDGLPARARSHAGEALLVTWAVGAFILAIFPTDLAGQRPTLHGVIHLIVAFAAFAAAAMGELLVSRRLSADPRFGAIAPAATAIAIGAIVMLVGVVALAGHAFGLVERVFLGLVLLWLAVVAARLQSIEPAA